ncbi:leucine-rich repeat domain-containing protein [Algibacter sp. TI.3.09]|uniref:leucine-rich repeat domain-containing protein n=1 Tax=Algibacter sp. TI.3.09 TaxID=3121298 RepID=UPI00311F1382
MKNLNLFILLLFNSVLFAQTPFIKDDIEYTNAGQPALAVEIKSYKGKATALALPSSVTNDANSTTYTVASIAFGAFFGSSLTGVTIPKSITSIGNNAFTNSKLENIDIPDTVTSVGAYAFSDNSLKTATISNTLTSLEDHVFSNNDLTTITIPNSIISVGSNAFSFNALTSVIIGDNVELIDNNAFYNNKIADITIPSSVNSIGDNAFMGNELKEITIPNSVTSIGENSFSENYLTHVVLGSNLTSIGNEAFADNLITNVESYSANPAALPSDAFNVNAAIDLFIPEGTTQKYEDAGWTGFKSVTEDPALTLSIASASLKNEFTIINTTNDIRVNGPKGVNVEELLVFNISGINVRTSKETFIETTTLPHGVYILQIVTDKGSAVKKFFK